MPVTKTVCQLVQCVGQIRNLDHDLYLYRATKIICNITNKVFSPKVIGSEKRDVNYWSSEILLCDFTAVLYCLTTFWRFRLESKQKEGSSASSSVSRAPSDRVRTLARPLVYPSSSTVTDCSTVSSSTRLVFAWRAFCRVSAAFCCRLFLGGIAESFRTQVTLVKETLSHISGKHAGLRNDVRSQ